MILVGRRRRNPGSLTSDPILAHSSYPKMNILLGE